MADLHYLTCRRCGDYLLQHDFPYCQPCNLHLAYRAFPYLLGLILTAPLDPELVQPLEVEAPVALQAAVGYDDSEVLIWE